MQINRQTYEEYFLLYNDGELTAEDRKAVEDFVTENPDLREELSLLQETVFRPDENIVFDNKEILYRHNSKVLSFPWFRVVAAAVVVLVLTVAGSLYMENDSELPKKALASKELMREEKNSQPQLVTVEPIVNTQPSPVKKPSEEIDRTSTASTSSILLTLNNTGETTNNPEKTGRKTETALEGNHENQSSPVHTDPGNEVVKTAVAREIIDVEVSPRDLAPASSFASNESVEHVQYAEEENNTIYFANTSLPKKTKLRGVFRKATRIFDKVTSLQ